MTSISFHKKLASPFATYFNEQHIKKLVCLFDLMLYLPFNNFSVMSEQVFLDEPVLSSFPLVDRSSIG